MGDRVQKTLADFQRAMDDWKAQHQPMPPYRAAISTPDWYAIFEVDADGHERRLELTFVTA